MAEEDFSAQSKHWASKIADKFGDKAGEQFLEVVLNFFESTEELLADLEVEEWDESALMDYIMDTLNSDYAYHDIDANLFYKTLKVIIQNKDKAKRKWNCAACTFLNSSESSFCEICETFKPIESAADKTKTSNYKKRKNENQSTAEPKAKKRKFEQYDSIHENAWNKALALNRDKLLNVPQWITCNKCQKWRTIKVAISTIKTWQAPSNWICEPSHCNKQINTNTLCKFERFVLNIQRCLGLLKANINPATIGKLEKEIQNYGENIDKGNIIITESESEPILKPKLNNLNQYAYNPKVNVAQSFNNLYEDELAKKKDQLSQLFVGDGYKSTSSEKDDIDSDSDSDINSDIDIDMSMTQKRRRNKFKQMEKKRKNLFNGKQICFAGSFGHRTQKHMKKMVTNYGGKHIKTCHKYKCDYLLMSNSRHYSDEYVNNNSKCKKAMKDNIPIVREVWLYDCIERNVLLDIHGKDKKNIDYIIYLKEKRSLHTYVKEMDINTHHKTIDNVAVLRKLLLTPQTRDFGMIIYFKQHSRYDSEWTDNFEIKFMLFVNGNDIYLRKMRWHLGSWHTISKKAFEIRVENDVRYVNQIVNAFVNLYRVGNRQMIDAEIVDKRFDSDAYDTEWGQLTFSVYIPPKYDRRYDRRYKSDECEIWSRLVNNTGIRAWMIDIVDEHIGGYNMEKHWSQILCFNRESAHLDRRQAVCKEGEILIKGISELCGMMRPQNEHQTWDDRKNDFPKSRSSVDNETFDKDAETHTLANCRYYIKYGC